MYPKNIRLLFRQRIPHLLQMIPFAHRTFRSVCWVMLLTFSALVCMTASADPRSLRVLDSQVVDLGSRSIIYDRVESPVLEPKSEPVAEPQLTAEELAEMRRWDKMHHVSLFLSCMVYDGKLTEVRFRQGNSDVVFWSSIDFRLFNQLTDFQIGDAYYSFIVAVSDWRREDFDQQKAELLRLGRRDWVSTWPSDLLAADRGGSPSAWRITSQNPVSPEALRTVEDLHAYFDSNRQDLMVQHEEREKARIAEIERLGDSPPVPEDTVIQFFPIRSSHLPDAARTLESALLKSSE